MSFGKDNGQLANIPAFGGSFAQRARTNARKAPRKSGGAPYWKGTFKPSEHTPDVGRLIPGEYLQQVSHDGETIVEQTFPYVMFKEHHNGRLGGICSAGPLFASKNLAQLCHPCVVFWEDVRERKAKKARGDTTKGPNRMSCRDQYSFGWWDYGLYFEMPDVDAKGQPRINNKTQKPFTHWEKGNQNDPKYQGKPWKQGHLLPWAMGGTYFDVLVTYSKKIGLCCASCCTRDSIKTLMKICGNPACGQFIYDPNNCTLTDEQRVDIDDYPYQCKHCGEKKLVDEIIECSGATVDPNTGAIAPCAAPKRATLFDVDLQVQRMGTKGQQTFLMIINFSDPRPIQVADPEILKTIVPLDLLKKYTPTSPELQLKIFGLQAAPPPVPDQGAGPPAIQPPGLPQQQMQPPPQQQMQLPAAPPLPMAPAPGMPAGFPPQAAPPQAAPSQPAIPQYGAPAAPQAPFAPPTHAPPTVVQPPGVPAHVQTLQPGAPLQYPQAAAPTMAAPAMPAAPMAPAAPVAPAAPAPPAVQYQLPVGQPPQQSRTRDWPVPSGAGLFVARSRLCRVGTSTFRRRCTLTTHMWGVPRSRTS